MLDLNSGDEFEIKLGKKAIRFTPEGGSKEENSAQKRGNKLVFYSSFAVNSEENAFSK